MAFGPMAALPYRMRGIALGLVVVLVLIFRFAPPPIADIVRSIANFSTVGLIPATVGTLLWFVYWVYLRKLLRVRRIANLRLRRMLEERESDSSDYR
jgi:hypothetical protein